MFLKSSLFLSLFGVLCCLSISSAQAQLMLNSFESASELQQVVTTSSVVSLSNQYVTNGSSSLQVNFLPASWSKIIVDCPNGVPWNCSGAAGLECDMTNPGDYPVNLILRAEDMANLPSSSTSDCRSGRYVVEPHETERFILPIVDSMTPWAYGVWDMPYGGLWSTRAESGVNPWNIGNIYDWSISIQNLALPATLYIDNVCTVSPVSMNGISDQYGQFTGGAWTGKVATNTDLATQYAAEQADIAANPVPANLDSYLGWLGGPQLQATGWYRTANINGKWWLVTPTGHLFFELGMDAVRRSDSTFTVSRTNMYQWLPQSSDPLAQFYGVTYGGYGGPVTNGQTFDFFQANLDRKYGASSWNADFPTQAIARLQSWGFNALGNSTDLDVFGHGFPESTRIDISGSYQTIPTGAGSGGIAPDPWDPNYDKAVIASIQPVVALYANDPYFIGYYVDNEMPFAGLGTLARYSIALKVLTYNASTSPAKQFFVQQLETEYSTIAALNAAWGTSLASWAALQASGVTIPSAVSSSPYLTTQCAADLSAFDLAQASQYFKIVSTELKKQDPNHLYLGSKFSINTWTPEALQACSLYTDVISANIYEPRLDASEWNYIASYNKPWIVGEFHMGATDRGVLSPGLVAATSTAQRAAMFQDYVQTALSSPWFVGVNWFKYTDQPTTGYSVSSENSGIGFLSVTDNPYPEMIAASRTLGQNMYTFRQNATAVTVGNINGQLGTPVALTANLSFAASTTPVTGQPLSFLVNGVVVGSATTDGNGNASVPYTVASSLQPGPQGIEVKFAGSASASPSNNIGILTVAPGPTSLTIPPVTIAANKAVGLSALLMRTDTGVVLSQRVVTFAVDGVVQGTATTHTNGIAYYNTFVPTGANAGSNVVTASWAGDSINAPCTGTGILTVTATPTALVVLNASGLPGANVTLSATLTRTDTKAALSGKTVTFVVGGQSAGTAVTGSNGVALTTYTIPTTLPSGPQTIAANFAGDTTNSFANGSATLMVQSMPTSLTVTNSSGQSGSAATLTAKLLRSDTGAVVVGRTVSFKLAGVVVGTATTDATGTASLTYSIPSGTSAGALAIAANFTGDTSYSASSGAATLTVTAIPTALALANVTGQSGSSVTIVAVLTHSDTGAPLPGKTVSISVNGSVVGTATSDTNGNASLSYPIPAGTSAGTRTNLRQLCR